MDTSNDAVAEGALRYLKGVKRDVRDSFYVTLLYGVKYDITDLDNITAEFLTLHHLDRRDVPKRAVEEVLRAFSFAAMQALENLAVDLEVADSMAAKGYARVMGQGDDVVRYQIENFRQLKGEKYFKVTLYQQVLNEGRTNDVRAWRERKIEEHKAMQALIEKQRKERLDKLAEGAVE